MLFVERTECEAIGLLCWAEFIRQHLRRQVPPKIDFGPAAPEQRMHLQTKLKGEPFREDRIGDLPPVENVGVSQWQRATVREAGLNEVAGATD